MLTTMDRRLSRDERRSETTRLFALISDASDAEARHDLVNQVIVINIGVAQAVAHRFRGRGIPEDDLEQVAFIALTRAAQKFDVAQDRDFLTYAVPTMSGELKRHFRDHGWTVRPPRRIQEIQARVINAYKAGHDAGQRPSASLLAHELDLAEVDVAEALTADGCFHPSSLDREVRPDLGPMTLGESLESDDSGSTQALEARLMLGPVLGGLDDRDRHILSLRFVEDLSQVEIGEILGVTQMQVSRLLRRIFKDLRDQIGSVGAAA
jgi:RNA polymerase sigma-B factor